MVVENVLRNEYKVTGGIGGGRVAEVSLLLFALGAYLNGVRL